MEDIDELIKTHIETLSPQELTTLESLTQDFMSDKIGKTELTRSRKLLFGLEDNHQEPKIDEKPKENPTHNEPKTRTGLRVRVRVKAYNNPKEDVTNIVPKIDLGKKMKDHTEEKQKKLHEVLNVIEERLCPSEMRFYKSLCEDSNLHKIEYRKLLGSILPLVKKYQRFIEVDKDPPRMSKRFVKVTPSYRLIPEEERSPVSDPVLNNVCVLMKVDDMQEDKELTDYEEDINTYEDDMYQTELLMETLRSAVERAEKVIRGEMRIEDIGVKFYRCAEKLYGEDMFEKVRDNHKRVLPVILDQLNQKLHGVIAYWERRKRSWKQAIKDISAKQRGSTARRRMKK